jgi:hypothetical protein
MPKPRDEAAILKAVEQIRYHAHRIIGGADMEFPPGERPRSPVEEMCNWSNDYPLHMISAPLDDVMCSFDNLQALLGVPLKDTRHHRFLCGGRD